MDMLLINVILWINVMFISQVNDVPSFKKCSFSSGMSLPEIQQAAGCSGAGCQDDSRKVIAYVIAV